MADSPSNFRRRQKEYIDHLLRCMPHKPFMVLPRAIEMSYIDISDLNSPILDLGCGDGFVTQGLLQRKNCRLFGGDISFKDVKLSEGLELYDHLAVFDITAAPFSDESFSAIMSICVLEHIPDLNKVLSEVYRVIKKGGKFQFTTPSDKFQELLFFTKTMNREERARYLDAMDKRMGHYRYFSQEDWHRELHHAGFENIQCRYIFNERAVKLWNFIEHYLTKIVGGKKIYMILYNTPVIGFIVRHSIWRIIFTFFFSFFLDTAQLPPGKGGYFYVQSVKPSAN